MGTYSYFQKERLSFFLQHRLVPPLLNCFLRLCIRTWPEGLSGIALKEGCRAGEGGRRLDKGLGKMILFISNISI